MRAKASQSANGRIGYRVNRQWMVALEGFNLTNRRASAIDYYYPSQLKGEAAPVDDIHFHPIESRNVRLTVHLSY